MIRNIISLILVCIMSLTPSSTIFAAASAKPNVSSIYIKTDLPNYKAVNSLTKTSFTAWVYAKMSDGTLRNVSSEYTLTSSKYRCKTESYSYVESTGLNITYDSTTKSFTVSNSNELTKIYGCNVTLKALSPRFTSSLVLTYLDYFSAKYSEPLMKINVVAGEGTKQGTQIRYRLAVTAVTKSGKKIDISKENGISVKMRNPLCQLAKDGLVDVNNDKDGYFLYVEGAEIPRNQNQGVEVSAFGKTGTVLVHLSRTN